MNLEPPITIVSPWIGTLCKMKDYKYLSVFVLLGILVLPAISQNPDNGQEKPADINAGESTAEEPSGPVPQMETLASVKNQMSYALGINIARNLQQNFPNANVDFLVLGLRDVFSGNPPKLNEERINASIAKYSEEAARVSRDRIERLTEEKLEKAEAFLEENGKKEGIVTTPSGLQYRIISQGAGPKARPDGNATINYTTRVMNGDIVESSVIDGVKPVRIDMASTIPAWREALSEMPLGSKWDVYAHPKLAYGEKGTKAVGPNELLIFNIELLGVD
jgi:FKBP-type peptidyl-prolyl cis-trans isomerase